MKPEPLIKELKCDDCGAIYANVIRTWDLKERIEWLKIEQDKLMNILCIWRLDKDIDAEKFADLAIKIINLSNKAFEDVVKKQLIGG